MLSVILRAMIEPRVEGQAIVEANLIPVVDAVESFVSQAGAEELPEGFPVRAAIVQLICAKMVHAACGDLAPILWPAGTATDALTRSLFLGTDATAPSDVSERRKQSRMERG